VDSFDSRVKVKSHYPGISLKTIVTTGIRLVKYKETHQNIDKNSFTSKNNSPHINVLRRVSDNAKPNT